MYDTSQTIRGPASSILIVMQWATFPATGMQPGLFEALENGSA